MRQKFEEAAYSMLHLLPLREQEETYDRFVYESGRADLEIGYWLFDPMPALVVRRVAGKYKAVSTYKEVR